MFLYIPFFLVLTTVFAVPSSFRDEIARSVIAREGFEQLLAKTGIKEVPFKGFQQDEIRDEIKDEIQDEIKDEILAVKESEIVHEIKGEIHDEIKDQIRIVAPISKINEIEQPEIHQTPFSVEDIQMF